MAVKFLSGFTLAFFLLCGSLRGQQLFELSIQQSQSITSAPAVHSGAVAVLNNEWIFIGGRKNGLHGFQPYNGFYPSEMNDSLFVFNPQTNQLWAQQVGAYNDTILHDCIIAAFNQYIQEDSMLYIIGGYGFDITANDYITHPYLIAVNLNQLVSHVKNGQPAEQDFRKLYHPEMAVTGGNVLKIDSTLYLTFGQKFDGRYSEMDSSGFFVQQYSNRIKKFNISDDGINLSINNYSEITDSTNFHRRDYNLVPQIFPDRVFGLTAFGGVFQYGVNLPYLNPINIKSSGNEVINNFNQYLNQYTTAVIPLYDSAFNAMHNIFLGGISEFTFDTLSQLNVQNAMVPFVKTISRFTRYSDSSMTEFALPVHMPDYLGTNAIFIPAASVPLYHNAIINLNALDTGDILIGYMISGILSTDSNISQISSYLSSANNLVYEIRIHKTGFTGINDFTLVNNLLNLKAYPIPFDNAVSIEFENKISQKVIVRAYDVSGKYIEEICNKDFQPGIIKLQWQPKSFSHQNYFIKVTTGKLSYNLKVLSH